MLGDLLNRYGFTDWERTYRDVPETWQTIHFQEPIQISFDRYSTSVIGFGDLTGVSGCSASEKSREVQFEEAYAGFLVARKILKERLTVQHTDSGSQAGLTVGFAHINLSLEVLILLEEEVSSARKALQNYQALEEARAKEEAAFKALLGQPRHLWELEPRWEETPGSRSTTYTLGIKEFQNHVVLTVISTPSNATWECVPPGEDLFTSGHTKRGGAGPFRVGDELPHILQAKRAALAAWDRWQNA